MSEHMHDTQMYASEHSVASETARCPLTQHGMGSDLGCFSHEATIHLTTVDQANSSHKESLWKTAQTLHLQTTSDRSMQMRRLPVQVKQTAFFFCTEAWKRMRVINCWIREHAKTSWPEPNTSHAF